ncbi:MAG: hypothetical protein ACTIDN_00170 [Acetobacter sp.]|uniref:hypothetical protein n=1 Tax=Acetobacter sp. TaxID=440 RepID=UPI003F8F06B1
MSELCIQAALVALPVFKAEAIARAWVLAGLVTATVGADTVLLTNPDAPWRNDIDGLVVGKAAPFIRFITVDTPAARARRQNYQPLKPTPAMQKFMLGEILPQDISSGDSGWIADELYQPLFSAPLTECLPVSLPDQVSKS